MTGGRPTLAVPLAVARERWRRRRPATVVLALLAGVSAAVPMALWSAGTRTAGAVEHFIATADVPDTTLYVCPQGTDPATESVDECVTHDAAREVDVIRSMPEVERVSRFAFSPAVGGTSPDASDWEQLGVASVVDPVPHATVVGEPVVLAGRLSDVDAADEVMVSEALAAADGIGPGDHLWLRSPEAPDDQPPVRSTVTGVIRTAADLLPLELESIAGPPVFARAGWADANGEDLFAYRGVAVWLDGDVDAFVADVRQRLDGQAVHADSAFPTDERENIELAIDFETGAARAIALVASLVAAFFVGQAVARQARTEADGTDTLLALGLTRRQVVAAALLRWGPVAAAAAALAVAVAAAVSTLGPIGVARRGPWDRGVQLDPGVLIVGGLAVAATVLAAAAVVVGRRAPGGGHDLPSRSVVPAVGPPQVRTGVALALRSLSRSGALPLLSAVGATALAIALVITAAGGLASLRLVLDDSERFGARWDALVAGAPPDVGERLAEVPGVVAASWLVGVDADIGDDELVWLQALVPVEGVEASEPVIVEGRVPVADDEIALGTRTQDRSGAAVGDEIEVEVPPTGEPQTYEVVGLTMITDGFEPNVGHGAIVTLGGLERVSGEPELGDVAVEVVDGAGRQAALDRLAADVPGVRIPFPVPSSLANAERISELPLQLALGAAVLAAVTFGHALVTSVRRNRRELAVYRALGFTRGQVVMAVASQASVLAVAAVMVGIPLGIVGARWAWRALAGVFGVTTQPLAPPLVVLVCAVAALVVANLAAAPPGWMAARTRPARSLRAE